MKIPTVVLLGISVAALSACNISPNYFDRFPENQDHCVATVLNPSKKVQRNLRGAVAVIVTDRGGNFACTSSERKLAMITYFETHPADEAIGIVQTDSPNVFAYLVLAVPTI